MNNKKKLQSKFSFKEQIQILKYLFSYAIKEKWLFLLSIILMLFSSGIAAYLPIIIQSYIDEYLATNSATLRITAFVALFYLGLLLIRMTLVYIKDLSFKVASERTVADIRNTIYKKLGSLSLDYFSKTPNGEVVSRVTNDTETIKKFWNVFLTFFDGLINATMIGVAMFSLNSTLAWIFMAFVPVVLLLIYIYQRISTVVYRKMRRSLGRVNSTLSESTSGMWLIKQFNQSERMKKEFDEVNDEYKDSRIKMFKMNALLLNPAVNLIGQLVLIILILLFGMQLLGGAAVNIGLVYAFTSYSKSFFQPITAMLDSLSIYQDGLVSASRGMALLNNENTAPEQNEGAKDMPIKGDTLVDDLYFSYDNRQDVLKGINLHVEPNQMIAIVGHTGSGKSTLINLLMRFYDFKRGEIKIDGKDIKSLSEETINSDIGLVQQNTFMFHGNFIDNIRLHGDYTEEEVVEAAKFSGADSFISKLDNGYYTTVSEGGSSLSAGEKQLINIARTILRSPEILILDEATASIDTETEQYFQRSLDKIRKESTLIVIAHRLSTIKDADKIYVLHKGQVIEEGAHDELISQEGTYYNMYQLQSLQGLS